MNRDRLELRLRTEPVPDEAAYVPRMLPATTAEIGTLPRTGRMSFAAPMAVLAAAAAVLVLVFAGSSWLREGRATGVGTGSGSPGGLASAAPRVDDGRCLPGDLLLRPEDWGGAAGSRGTVLSVSLASTDACILPGDVAVQILDGNGRVLVEGSSPSGGDVVLGPGATYQVGISWSNWCDIEPQPALRWNVRFGDGEWIDVIEEVSATRPELDVPSSVPVPPCLGEGGTALSVTDLQAGP